MSPLFVFLLSSLNNNGLSNSYLSRDRLGGLAAVRSRANAAAIGCRITKRAGA
ncbi:hypothetical protein SPI_03442 [Niveomyces insectorum RCEF 264]|uniref:Uncharacterized protein n=1 Tax=Niveomyces insectorum RCEF 264 TaxID=1081102 RepID=A0A167W350_9HYPO|nr:hypothetical protein SPI_03442 [Niveomyces insectorum RCEF 264]